MLVDHGTLVRAALAALIEQQPDLVVVAQASTIGDAGTFHGTPDVIVTDIDMPDARHRDVISGLREAFPQSPILVLTFVGHPAKVQSVLAAGANGYLLKTAATPDLLSAIRALAAGEIYVQPSLDREVERWRRSRDTTLELTPKEEQVLRLLAVGHTNDEVAALLGVSRRTVETHRGRINEKLGLRTRAEVFRYAWDVGLLEREPQ
jgi:DNA-binding NarL/FixJ family response regulator